MQDLILYIKKGSGELFKSKRIESELLQTKINKRKKWIYLSPGISPFVMEKNRNMIGRMLERPGIFGPPERNRFYLVREGEPFVRDAFSGEHVDREAMFETMFQHGAIDEFGLLLDPDEKRPYDDDSVLTKDEYIKLKSELKGKFEKNFEAEGWDRPLYTKEDVGNMEMLLEQSLLIFDGKVAQGLSISAKKSLLSARDITMWILIIGTIIWNMFALYFLLKGAGYAV